ncbi:hypothetical protein SAMN05216285_2409 [Natrinema salifodinae]|uniref:Uncharacterized protein n=1 Tax=Natrinema salifodinae TaxID=1202768 RepID=A0A1I0PCT3_9EURY|nr:hypothetical protein SAMN05216285_2409 [Natrinema salifodinae]
MEYAVESDIECGVRKTESITLPNCRHSNLVD